MKLRIIAILVVIAVSFPLAVSAVDVAKSIPIHIQAGYGSIASITVTPIAAQSQSYLVGMPFNIEDALVQSTNSGLGRLIADWTLLANVDFELEIEINALKHETKDYYIPYELSFEYQLGYYDANGLQLYSPEEPFKVISTSDANSRTQVFSILDPLNAVTGAFVGNNTGAVYVKLTEEGSGKVADAPVGSYSADVVLTIRQKE